MAELMLVRIRHHGRTYWMASNGECTRSYAPHVSQSAVIERFEAETGARHDPVLLHRAHHKPSEAERLFAKVFSAAAADQV